MDSNAMPAVRAIGAGRMGIEAKQRYDLVVLGVSRRPGDTLFFGNTATAVLDHSNVSNLFVAG